MVLVVVADDGRVSWVLRPLQNKRGSYWMGNSRLEAVLDLRELVLFAHEREDGSLVVTAEQYDPGLDNRSDSKKT